MTECLDCVRQSHGWGRAVRRSIVNCGTAILVMLAVFSLPQVYAHAEKRAVDAGTMADCRGKGDKAEVIAACTQILNTTRDKSVLERAYNRRGLAYESLEQFSLAVDDFTQVIRLNPKIAGYFDNRQRVLSSLGRFDEALTDANTAVKMAPTYPFVFHGRGAVYANLSRYNLAIQDFNTALSINPSDAPLLVDRGKVYRTIGLIDNAMDDFNRAHDVDPSFVGALRERGLTYQRLGKFDAARDDLLQVLASKPEGEQDTDVVTALQQLSGSDTVSRGPALAFSAETTNAFPPVATPSADEVRRAAEKAQAEQRLRVEKEALAARQATAAKQRAERFERASAAAKQAIDEGAAFVKANPSSPKTPRLCTADRRPQRLTNGGRSGRYRTQDAFPERFASGRCRVYKIPLSAGCRETASDCAGSRRRRAHARIAKAVPDWRCHS